jgi:hypothetical protein
VLEIVLGFVRVARAPIAQVPRANHGFIAVIAENHEDRAAMKRVLCDFSSADTRRSNAVAIALHLQNTLGRQSDQSNFRGILGRFERSEAE